MSKTKKTLCSCSTQRALFPPAMPVSLSAEAYTLATLHCVAHPERAVNGVLLGPRQGKVTRCLPLFHSHNLALSPPYETALAFAEAEATRHGLKLVGCYYASERGDETELPPLARRLGDAIGASCPGAVALLARGSHSAPVISCAVTLTHTRTLSGERAGACGT